MTPALRQTGLGRSWDLLSAFRREQIDPRSAYSVLGADAADTVARFAPVRGALVIDVGGGPGYTAEALEALGAHAVTVDPDPTELYLHGRQPARAVVGNGLALPFGDATVDICCSFNAIEHVADPWTFLGEAVRVVKPGGLIFIGVTNWLSPWGGHETSPWHYLGGERAVRRYQRRSGVDPKNRYGESLYPIGVGQLIAWSQKSPNVRLIDAFPRYYPRWCRPIVRLPGLREVITWNLGLALERQ